MDHGAGQGEGGIIDRTADRPRFRLRSRRGERMTINLPDRKNALVKDLLRKSALALLPAVLLAAKAGTPIPSRAAAEESDGVICTVGQQMDNPDLCGTDGPAGLRVEFWEQGLWPRSPMPVLPLDPALGELDRYYARAGKDTEVGFYANVEDAIANNPHHRLRKGFIFVSFVDVIRRAEGTFLRTGNGWIVRRDEVAPISYAEQFTGFVLAESPVRPFGWVLPYEGVYPSRTPGGPADQQAAYYPWYAPVEVFDRQEAGGAVWYLVGINQWVEETKLGLVFPGAERPSEIPDGVKWISVDLYEQSLAAYEGDRMVFATLVASGLPGYWTRPGVFQVKKKYEIQTMSGSFEEDYSDYYYVMDVPWVMYFDSDRAIHGEYWHNNLGSRHSHGCVNVPVADGRWLYDWAPEGTWVNVFDPSGKTPTDDKYYPFDSRVP
jgi:hypothetical protein